MADQWGWRQTYLAAAVVLAILTVPAHAVLLRRPWPTEQVDSGSDLDSMGKLDGAGERVSEPRYAARVLRRGQFWLLAIGLTAVALAMYASLLAMVPGPVVVLVGSYAIAFLVLAVVAAIGTGFLIASTRQPSVITQSRAGDC